MRIIGEIDHPVLKITVFKNEGKLSVKFESGLLEQTYKLRPDDRIQDFDDVKKLIDESFIAEAERILKAMYDNRDATFARNVTAEEADEFEVIV